MIVGLFRTINFLSTSDKFCIALVFTSTLLKTRKVIRNKNIRVILFPILSFSIANKLNTRRLSRNHERYIGYFDLEKDNMYIFFEGLEKDNINS